VGNKGVLSKILTELKEAMRENMQRKKQKKAIKKEKQPRFLAEPPFTESELKFMKAVEKLNRLQKKLGKKAILKMAKKELEIEPYRFEGIIQELNETYCTLGLTRLAQLAGIPLD
jgi:glucose-6-phosphate 1-dehydrogenase